MNSDDFEKRFERQTIRPIPGEWRREVLQQAKEVSSSQIKPHPLSLAVQTLFRELIWPCRRAWTGMAALWLVLWGINLGLSSGQPALQSAQVTPSMLQAMEEQRQLLAELIPPASTQPAEPPRRNHSQPRSERRIETFMA